MYVCTEGGAERLVVDVASALKAEGHDVRILTSHHDRTHCFEETRGDGKVCGIIITMMV
jgi:hypothetical protein